MRTLATNERYVPILGTSLIVFGVGGLLSSIVALFVTGGGMIDLWQVAVIFNGVAVRRGGERAMYWATVLTAIYAFVQLFVTVLFMCSVGITVGGDPDTTIQERPWLLALFLPLCAWTMANFLMCLHIRRRRVRIKRGQCASCGYSLRENTSDVCPECGATK